MNQSCDAQFRTHDIAADASASKEWLDPLSAEDGVLAIGSRYRPRLSSHK
jgi:hypothetical protein